MREFVFYDDLEPGCLDSGIVVLKGTGLGDLYARCRAAGLTVVADVHTHPGVARQSELDRTNPMVAQVGHIALIVPGFARGPVRPHELGVYEYQGSYRWRDHSGPRAPRYLYLGFWG